MVGIFYFLIDEEFPKDHTLSKIFNRNTIKVSYGCMTNVKQAIDGRNKTILNNQTTAKRNEKQCNCRKPQDCPVSGRCLNESVIYQATVKTDNGEPEQTYVGLTANSFKTRYANHKASFKNEKKKSNTELSKYQGRRNKGGRRGNCPPCPLAGGARGAKVPFWFITADLINCKIK